MVAHGLCAPLHIDMRFEFVAQRNRSARHRTMMTGYTGLDLLCIGDIELCFAAAQNPGIADLSTGFRIKRRGIQNHDTVLSRFQPFDRYTFAVQRNHSTRFIQFFVTDKVRLFAVIIQNGRHLELAGCTCCGPLFFHSGIKPLFIHGNRPFTANIRRQIQREAIRIVQRKCRFAIEHFRAAGKRSFQNLHSVIERFAETFFFMAQYTLDIIGGFGQFRIGSPHFFHEIIDQLVEERFRLTKLVTMAQCAADNPAQYITMSVTPRNHRSYRFRVRLHGSDSGKDRYHSCCVHAARQPRVVPVPCQYRHRAVAMASYCPVHPG